MHRLSCSHAQLEHVATSTAPICANSTLACCLRRSLHRCTQQQPLQVREEASGLALLSGSPLRVSALGPEATDSARRWALAHAGHIVICTPGKLLAVVTSGALPAAQLAASLKVCVGPVSVFMFVHVTVQQSSGCKVAAG